MKINPLLVGTTITCKKQGATIEYDPSLEDRRIKRTIEAAKRSIYKNYILAELYFYYEGRGLLPIVKNKLELTDEIASILKITVEERANMYADKILRYDKEALKIALGLLSKRATRFKNILG